MDTLILKSLREIKADLISGKISTSSELAVRLSKAAALTGANMRIPKLAPSETPSSTKFNKTAEIIENNLKNNEYIFDILLAASIYDYDTALEMMNNLEDKIAGLADSVKTLYFFSEPARGNVHIVGTDFRMGWGQFNNGESKLNRDTGAGLTLPIVTKKAAVGKGFYTGNGICGNFFLVDNNKRLLANGNSYNKMQAAVDCDPTTHLEYERFKISEAILLDTKGFGFGFHDSEVVWASPSYDSVNLELTFTFPTPIQCNYLTITPAAPSDEFVVQSIVLYSGGVEAAVLEPQELIINQELMMHGQEGYANEGAYIFEPVLVDKCIIKFYSTTAQPCTIAHYYEVDDNGQRVAGSSPPVSKPHFYLNQVSADDEYQKIEYLAAQRFAIGLKDIFLQNITYGTEGYALSKPIRFQKPIDRLALTADYKCPDKTTLTFSVSFNDGQKWYDINPLGSSVKNQVIAINDMIPSAYQDPSTMYISESGSPTQLLFRISFKRDKGKNNITPVVRKVELEVTLKP